jgi:hypothetical protein
MTMLLAAADRPRVRTRAYVNPPVTGSSPPSGSLPVFQCDAERCAWIAAQYRRRSAQPLINRAKLARDVAALAFEVTLQDLCGPSRKSIYREPRQKIACIIHVLTGASVRQIGRLLSRKHNTIVHCLNKYGQQIAAHMERV